MKVLVVGKNGQVGSCLVALFTTMPDITLLALDRAQLDITDAIQVVNIVTEFQPDVIINAAAYTYVDNAEQEQQLAYAINRDGPHNLAVAAQKIDAVIIHISTDYVFAGDKLGSYNETDHTQPQGEYGRSKLAGEQAVAAACARHIILRTAWVFGKYGNNFVKTMLRLAKTRDTLGVVADQFGGPTYAGDIASAIVTISKQITDNDHAYGIYHFSGYPHVSWHAFAESIFNVAQTQGLLTQTINVNEISTQDYPTPAKRPANSTLDCQKIDRIFGIKQSDWQRALTCIKEYE
ncbi:dTDP-4-dehydrorhamnose reductase [Shewanella frigidimarina]|uniref:dTDP-4-dehydrorhamnose reductase n=1 Tax=Shewanella frigidimarina TaxID=56812 RepID=A0A106C3H4_SHEFR|nr:dTDP-4-dehydrorhamnose reductase [Shewanella frigidimarina]KVX03526.1 dTDP-4-dehydrorhamnose reductase [Shewanella frigidimarina]